MLEVAWLAALSGLLCLNTAGVAWLAWRSRSRGFTATFDQTTAGGSGAMFGALPHIHEYAHNPGDGYFYCACGERKKLG